MFDEQVGWAVDEAADFIIGETFCWTDEALTALDVIRAAGLPSVITFAVDPEGLHDGADAVTACKRVADAGADVVGLNCSRGPATMQRLAEEIRDAVSCHVAALPIPYRTTPETVVFQNFRDTACNCLPNSRAFPLALDPFQCNRFEISEFAKAAYAKDVKYLGLCCGAGPHHVRAMAEALGRTPPASHYSADMSKHAYEGTDPNVSAYYEGLGKKLYE